MDQQDLAPFVQSVLHPTDFSEASHLAFVHALALAVRRQTRLTLLHVVGDDEAADQWDRFPAVRETLERWGQLEQGSDRGAVWSLFLNADASVRGVTRDAPPRTRRRAYRD